jgi:hypothetical protein
MLCWRCVQMGFNEFLHRCEMLDFDFDPKLAQHGRMHTRDMHKLKARCSPAARMLACMQRPRLLPAVPALCCATTCLSQGMLCTACCDG